MMTVRSAEEGGLAAYAAIFCVTIAGNAFIALAPLFVGGMIDHWAMTESDVGALMSYEFLGTTVATVLGMFFLHRPNWPLRGTAFGALAILAIGNLGTPFVHHHPGLLAMLRLICGLCAGLTWIVSATAIAQLPNNRRALALFYGSPFFTGMVLQPVMPTVFGTLGLEGAFFLIAASAALCFLMYGSYLPSGRPTGPVRWSAFSLPRGRRLPTVLVLVSFLLQYVANTGLPVYFERIGVGAGHSLQTTANALSVALAFAVLGALLASAVADRLRPVPAIAAGTVLICLASVLVLGAERLIAFTIAASLFNLMITFITPFYFMVLARSCDAAEGTILGNIAMIAGFSAGPLLIGSTVSDAGYLWPVIATLAMFALSIGLLFVYSMTRTNTSNRFRGEAQS